mgnify:CR=1 FL=1|jgi:hypothetical protein
MQIFSASYSHSHVVQFRIKFENILFFNNLHLYTSEIKFCANIPSSRAGKAGTRWQRGNAVARTGGAGPARSRGLGVWNRVSPAAWLCGVVVAVGPAAWPADRAEWRRGTETVPQPQSTAPTGSRHWIEAVPQRHSMAPSRRSHSPAPVNHTPSFSNFKSNYKFLCPI